MMKTTFSANAVHLFLNPAVIQEGNLFKIFIHIIDLPFLTIS